MSSVTSRGVVCPQRGLTLSTPIGRYPRAVVPHTAIRQLEFHGRCFQRNGQKHRRSRFRLLPSHLLSNQRLWYAISKLAGPTIEGRAGNSFLQTKHGYAQTACLLNLKPLLPIQVLIKSGGWTSHHLSP